MTRRDHTLGWHEKFQPLGRPTRLLEEEKPKSDGCDDWFKPVAAQKAAKQSDRARLIESIFGAMPAHPDAVPKGQENVRVENTVRREEFRQLWSHTEYERVFPSVKRHNSPSAYPSAYLPDGAVEMKRAYQTYVGPDGKLRYVKD